MLFVLVRLSLLGSKFKREIPDGNPLLSVLNLNLINS